MTVTAQRRRRRRRGGVPAAGARLRARPGCSSSPPVRWQAVGTLDDFPNDTYVPQVITDRRRASARPARRPSTCARATTKIDEPPKPAGLRRAVRRDLHALHAPRLPGALRRGRRSASSARATAASTTSRARSTAARRCARSTASTPGSRNGQVEVGPRYSVNSRAQALLASATRRSPRRHRPVPLPGALLDAESSMRPADAPKLPFPTLLQAQAAPKRPGEADGAASRSSSAKEAGITRGRLGRRAHVAVGRPRAG